MSDFLSFNQKFFANPEETKEEKEINVEPLFIDRDSNLNINDDEYVTILASDFEVMKKIFLEENLQDRVNELKEKIEESTDTAEIEELTESIRILEERQDITFNEFIEQAEKRGYSKEVNNISFDENNEKKEELSNRSESVNVSREMFEYLLRISFPKLDEIREKIEDLNERIENEKDTKERNSLIEQKNELERDISISFEEFNQKLSTRNSNIKLENFNNNVKVKYRGSGNLEESIINFALGIEENDSVDLDGFVREENSLTTNDLDFFVKKSVPYLVNKGINQVLGSVDFIGDVLSPTSFNDVFSIGKAGLDMSIGAMNLWRFVSMLSNEELLKIATLNFYNLTENRGIEIKTARRTLSNPTPNSFEADGKYSDFSYNKKSYDEVMELKKDWRDFNKIGHIYIYPASIDGGPSNALKIPFEFNPTIGAAGISAKYESKNMLGRIGNLQSYINSEPDSLSISTKYIALSPGIDESYDYDSMGTANEAAEYFKSRSERIQKQRENNSDEWMSYFTLEKIQQIEKAYQSLALPQIIKLEDEGVEYSVFHKPPVIKIKMGSSEEKDTNGVFHMLTYPKKYGSENKVHYHHKTFIVTNVKIEKKLDEAILHMDREKGIINTREFEVSLDLMEIDPNYIGQMPTANDYLAVAKRNNDLIAQEE